MIRPQYHFRTVGDDTHIWDVRKLILLDHPITDHPVDQITDVDEPYWSGHGNDPATCRDILKHAELINDVDLNYPILLCAAGRMIDGMHRTLKAISMGHKTIRAKHIPLPAPDYKNRHPDSLPY